jgi:hypothetical protein
MSSEYRTIFFGVPATLRPNADALLKVLGSSEADGDNFPAETNLVAQDGVEVFVISTMMLPEQIRTITNNRDLPKVDHAAPEDYEKAEVARGAMTFSGRATSSTISCRLDIGQLEFKIATKLTERTP